MKLLWRRGSITGGMRGRYITVGTPFQHSRDQQSADNVGEQLSKPVDISSSIPIRV